MNVPFLVSALGLVVLGITTSGCIGTDFLEESVELFEPRVEVSPAVEAIEINEQIQYQATYFDSTAMPQPATFVWSSTNEDVVQVSQDGSATGVGPGQARITAETRGISSEMALLTVVENADEVAFVTVSPADTNITVGGLLQYVAIPVNARNETVTGLDVQWETSVDSIAAINDQGLLTAVRPGSVTVTASTEGIQSMPARLDVFARSRTGSFQAAQGSSYRVEGTGVLEQTDASLQVRFLDNFSVSNGPDLHVYLSTQNRVNATSIDLGALQSTTGAQMYSVPANVRMNDFDFIIIHCVPFNVSFGFARIN